MKFHLAHYASLKETREELEEWAKNAFIVSYDVKPQTDGYFVTLAYRELGE